MKSPSTPSICVSHHSRPRSPLRRSSSYLSNSSLAAPMPIPHTGRDPPPPPPLPPPRNIEELGLTHEPAWPWTTNPHWTGFGSAPSVKPGSSLLGGKSSPSSEHEHEYEHDYEGARRAVDAARRRSSISTVIPAYKERQVMEGSATSTTSSDDDGRSSALSSSHRYEKLYTSLCDVYPHSTSQSLLYNG